jgi:two-component system NtrC family sensor kinase
MKPASHNSETVCMTNRRQGRTGLPLTGGLAQDLSSNPAPDAESRATETLRASHKLIELGRLSASIAHEINNPLSSITNLLFLLRQEPELSPLAKGYLDLIDSEMDRVIAISKQTLNFSRESSEPDHVQLVELVEEVLFLYRHRMEQKHLELRREYTPAEAVWGNPGELRQVLSNLIVNAIDANRQRGRLQLRVRKATNGRGDPGVRVTVADTGAGIPPEVLRRLGEPFFTTKGQQGTGLGLWVTRAIVERHGGELRLRSRWGGRRHGTVFSLFLPLAAPVGGASQGPMLVSAASRSRSLTDISRAPRDAQPEARRAAGD